MTKLSFEALQASVDSLIASLKAAEENEAAARTAHTAARQQAGYLRQQLHFARMRLAKHTDAENRAMALFARSQDASLTQRERDAAREAYFELMDKAIE